MRREAYLSPTYSSEYINTHNIPFLKPSLPRLGFSIYYDKIFGNVSMIVALCNNILYNINTPRGVLIPYI